MSSKSKKKREAREALAEPKKKEEPKKVIKPKPASEQKYSLNESISRLDTIITLETENKNPQAADAARRLKKCFEAMLGKK